MKSGSSVRLSSERHLRVASLAVLLAGAGPAVGQTSGALAPQGAAKPALAPPQQSAPAPVADAWTPAEIAAGIAQCQALLSTAVVTVTPVPPFKSGDCGSPAAVELVSIGRKPEIKLEPAVVVTCELAATLATWATSDLQPLALKHLGAPITRIDTMSSYSCRNAYGRKKTRLSEHGRANAIDIRAFVTARNEEASVLADWGPSERRMQQLVAAAKAEEAKRLAAAKAVAPKDAPADKASPAPAPATAVASAPAAPPAAGSRMALTTGSTTTSDPGREDATLPLPRLRTILEGLPNAGRNIPSLPRPSESVGFGPPSYLGGAKPIRSAKVGSGSTTVRPEPTAPQRQQFLKAVHASACRTFGTVLGPEANAAHENHFHFDMAERRNGNYCE